jgi:XTP/dITP diphosphohydrolase
MRLVLASNNAKKLGELRALFAGLAIELQPQGDLGIGEAEEPHITFVENALAKARHAAAASRGAAMADDSGLCVDALGGEPGVQSAVYAAAPAAVDTEREARRQAQDRANNVKLLLALQGVTARRAAFVSTLVAVRHPEDPEPLIAFGRWPGEILHAPDGEGGFGYDPLMFIPDLGSSVARLEAAVKNSHSHRARAAAQMRQLLNAHWHLG